jgi:hypothetical protein
MQNDLVCVRLYFTNSSSHLVVACGQPVILTLIFVASFWDHIVSHP